MFTASGTLLARAFVELARKYGGLSRGEGLFRRPAVWFVYSGRNCQIRLVRRRFSRDRLIEFRIEWSNRQDQLEIAGKEANWKLASGGLRPIPSGSDDPLSRQLVVQGSPAESMARLLSPAARWRILQLVGMSPKSPLRVVITGGTLYVVRECWPADFQELDDFVRYALELHDQFHLAVSEGIAFHEQVAEAIDEMRCPVCSCDIEGPLVLCMRCRTPHCLDCWQYNGRCGMYACNETRYLMSQ